MSWTPTGTVGARPVRGRGLFPRPWGRTRLRSMRGHWAPTRSTPAGGVRVRLARLALVALVTAGVVYFLPPLSVEGWLRSLASPLAGCSVSGTVTLAGRTDHSGSVVTAEGAEPAVTSPDGSFSLKVADTVAIGVAHPGYLAGQAAPLSCEAFPTVMKPLALPAGDVNGDNQVDLLDLTAVAAAYGTCGDSAGYDLRSDLNESGCVDILDLVLLGTSYQTQGPIAWAPAAPSQSPPPDDPGQAVSYADDVDPIMQAQCRHCHGDSGGISVRDYASLMAGGRSGPSVVPGDPEASLLYRRLTGAETPVMPPGGVSLAGDDIELIRRWIAEGARDS